MKQHTEFRDTEECGCGSGSSYVNCCKKNRVQYTRDGRGRVNKTVVLDQNGRNAVEEALTAFKDTFGRTPDYRDRMLLAAYRYSPQDYRKMFLEIAAKANIPKHLVYAYIQTDGLILTEENEELASPQDIEDVQIAVEEYLAVEEDGLDLLQPEDTILNRSLDKFSKFIEDSVVFIGNFADKAPRAVRKNLPLFFQFLLISRCHQSLKLIADGWPKDVSSGMIAIIRTVYECALIINRLEVEPTYADTLLAQALVGSELFNYRVRKSGELDFSVVIELSSGKKFEARTSFFGCAKRTGQRHADLFNIAYPILSSHAHFNSLSMLQSYRSSGSFLIWEEDNVPYKSLIILSMILYLLVAILSIDGTTKVIKRDAFYFFKGAYYLFLELMSAMDTEEAEIDGGMMLLTIRLMELCLDKDFITE